MLKLIQKMGKDALNITRMEFVSSVPSEDT